MLQSKVNGKSFYPGQEDQNARGINRRASVLKENHSSYPASEFCDVPFESDRKEKFKMVIGKSKKEAQETEKESQESGFTVDAAAVAVILQAATKGMKSSGLQIISSTAANCHIKEDGLPANFDSVQTLLPYSTVEKSDHLKTGTASHGAAGGADSSVANLTEEQKLKAERLKRAKMFVAMLKSGALPCRTGTSRGSSAEPIEPGMLKSAGEVSRASQEKEGSLAPAVVEKPGCKGNFDERQSERRSKRKYRSRSIGSEDDEEDSRREGHSSRKYKSSSRRHGDTKSLRSSHHSQGDDVSEGTCEEERYKKDNEHHSERTHRSRSRSHKGDEEVGNAVENDRKHNRRRHRSHSSSEESENGEERDEHDAEHKHYKTKHRSHNSQSDDDEREGTHKEERDKEHRKSRSRRSSGSKSRRHKDNSGSGNAVEKEDRYYKRKHSSYEDNGGESSGDEKDQKRSKGSRRSRHKKHRSSHTSSHHSRDKDRHRNGHASKDKESRRRHSSSDEEYEHPDQTGKEVNDVREELEEGEIGAKVSQDGGHGERETSVDVLTTEVPADLRAKIRAMLMATRS